MSLSTSTLLAVKDLEEGNVKPELASFNYLYFMVKDKQVTFDLRKKAWRCSCVHEVYRNGRDCHHIKSCKMWLEKKSRVLKKEQDESANGNGRQGTDLVGSPLPSLSPVPLNTEVKK